MKDNINNSRRKALQMTILGAGMTAATAAPGQARDLCGLTPVQTKGPFYPVKDQIDKDADLTAVQGKMGKARGQEIFIQGIVADQSCTPVAAAMVEIWQACVTGKYNHPNDPNPAPLDPNFQYWGRALTDASGLYRFKTIIPGAYPADTGWVRPPHIHFKVQKIGYAEMITQLYFQGQTLNSQDRILQSLPDYEQKKVVVPLVDVQMPQLGIIKVANFNIAIQKIGAMR